MYFELHGCSLNDFFCFQSDNDKKLSANLSMFLSSRPPIGLENCPGNTMSFHAVFLFLFQIKERELAQKHDIYS